MATTKNDTQGLYELVDYRLPLQKGSNGVYVNVNEHNMFIPPGETVQIPRYMVEVLENSLNQDVETQRRIRKLSKKMDSIE